MRSLVGGIGVLALVLGLVLAFYAAYYPSWFNTAQTSAIQDQDIYTRAIYRVNAVRWYLRR